MDPEDLDETELLKLANNASNVFSSCQINESIQDTKGNALLIRYIQSCSSLDIQSRASLMKSLEKNMKSYYESTWGWKQSDKFNELFASDSKFIIVTNSINEIIAWTMFKFDWDDLDEPEHPVLFCYELQVIPEYQKCGIGKIIMDILVKIGNHYHMWKTMLTCFKCNSTALQFYQSIGFNIDCNSPSRHGYTEECYEILSNRPNIK